MSKVLKNTAIKVIAIVLFCISIVTGLVSGVVAANMIRFNFDKGAAEEQVRNALLSQLCYNYECIALECYDEMIFNGERNMNQYYSDLFAEENCNFAFTIQPKSLKYPTLTNYKCDDYQYSHTFSDERIIIRSEVTFEFSLTEADMIGMISYYYEYGGSNEEVWEGSTTTEIQDGMGVEYDTTQASIYVEDIPNYSQVALKATDAYYLSADNTYSYEDELGDIHIVFLCDTYQLDCNLNQNRDYIKAFDNFLDEKILKNYNFYEMRRFYYDSQNGIFHMTFSCGDAVEIEFSEYVKSNLTAKDDFYNSFLLRFWIGMVKSAIPMFIISCIIILITFIYIVMAAGHVKGHDGIYLNTFHRIPFDIVVVGYLTLFALASDIYSNNTGIYNPVIMFAKTIMIVPYLSRTGLMEVLLAIVCVVPILAASAIMISTVSARIKDRKLFSNTLIWRIIKWCGRVLKRLWKTMLKQGTYLRENIKIYWKWLGVYAIVSIAELFMCLGAQDYVFVISLWVVEKIIISVILAIAAVNMQKLKKGAEIIAGGNTEYELETQNMLWEFKKHGENLNRISDGIQLAVEDRMRSEKMKTELITNVSHDIKTPLTSIINYVDLLSKEELDNPKAVEYLEVLDRQSAKLKKLIQDLIDASKASTGNMPVNLEAMDLKVLLEQITGEYEEKFATKQMRVISRFSAENTMVMADGKHIWRVFDNLVNNILKYGQNNTRVYIDVEEDSPHGPNTGTMLNVSIKNISREELNITGGELMERFVRGDSSRNTEGSGLGLSIAKSLMEIQGGTLDIVVDGDLFKVVLALPGIVS